MREVEWIAVVSCLLGLAAIVWLSPAAWGQSGAHGQGHDQHHDWYKDLKQPGTQQSCCNKLLPDGSGDCRPTQARQDAAGNWVAMIDGRWTPVPPSVVLEAELNQEWGMAHICANRGGYIYCFLPKRTGG